MRTLRHINDYTCEVTSSFLGDVDVTYVRAPKGGGYVRWDGEQVTSGMGDRGGTLTWRPGDETITQMCLRHFHAAGKDAVVVESGAEMEED